MSPNRVFGRTQKSASISTMTQLLKSLLIKKVPMKKTRLPVLVDLATRTLMRASRTLSARLVLELGLVFRVGTAVAGDLEEPLPQMSAQWWLHHLDTFPSQPHPGLDRRELYGGATGPCVVFSGNLFWWSGDAHVFPSRGRGAVLSGYQ